MTAATDYHAAYDRIDADGRCPNCGNTALDVDLEAPRATCRECNTAKVGPGLWAFIPMLYHVAPQDAVPKIREEGIIPANNADSRDPLRVAEETRDRLLDERGRERFGAEYEDRRHSVFFYADRGLAVREAEKNDAAVIRVDPDDLTTTLYSADRQAVESLHTTILDAIRRGSVTAPEYEDDDSVEAEAERIAAEDFRQWTGGSDPAREVWGVGRIRPGKIDGVTVPGE